MRRFLFLLTLAIPPLPAAPAERVHNPLVAVTESTIEPGGTESWPGDHPSVTFYFTNAILEIAWTGLPTHKTVKRGEAVFTGAKTTEIRNAGKSEVRFARIEFLGGGQPVTWGTIGLSPNYVLLLENQYTRVYDIRIPAGAREPQHTHHDRVVVCLQGATLKHLMPDGREEPSTLRTGEVVWRHGGTHIGQNLGKTGLWVIAVEPK